MEPITLHIDDGVMVLTLNRADKRNALTKSMYSTLLQALQRAEQAQNINVILLQGSQTCFTAGNDLNDFLEVDTQWNALPAVEFIRLLPTLTKPLIAAVSGPAVGIGTTLLLHCDLVYASTSARFQLPFVNLGLVPEAGASVLLPALCGYPKAAELLLLGEPFAAELALKIGLVNQLLAPDEILEFALAKAKQLATKPTQAVQASKALLKRSKPAELTTTMNIELEQFFLQLKSEQTQTIINRQLQS